MQNENYLLVKSKVLFRGDADDVDDDIVESNDDVVDAITIGEDSFTLDKDGNAIDKEGAITYTSEQIAELEKDPDPEKDPEKDPEDLNGDSFTLDDVSAISGIKIERDGEELTFDGTAEGFAQRELAIAEQSKEIGKSNAIVEFLKSNPELNKAYKHLSVNGSLDSFNKTTSYKDTKLDENSITQLTSLVRASLTNDGMDKARADNYIKFLIDNDTIKDEAVSSLAKLKASEKLEDDALANTYQSQLDSDQDARNKFTSDVNTVIAKGKVNNYTLPTNFTREKEGVKTVATRAEFVDYMTTAKYKDASGNIFTEYEKDKMDKEGTSTIDDSVLEAISLFTGNTNTLTKLVSGQERKRLIVKRTKAKVRGKSIFSAPTASDDELID